MGLWCLVTLCDPVKSMHEAYKSAYVHGSIDSGPKALITGVASDELLRQFIDLLENEVKSLARVLVTSAKIQRTVFSHQLN